MEHYPRAGHMDVSNTVDVSDPVAVAHAVKQLEVALDRIAAG